MRHELGAALILIVLFSATLRADVITFEEPILQPNTVSLQYCNLGVEFIGTGQMRVFEPLVATSSPPNALTNDIPGDELGEFEEIEIRFTAGQSKVSFDVGLHENYEFVASGIVAELFAYASPTPGIGLLATDSVDLGTTQTPITQRLRVDTESLSIRSLRIRFRTGIAPLTPAFEVIDDLSFNVVGPPCSNDTEPPAVQITEPAIDGTPFNERNILLGFTASDDVRVAEVEVSFLDQANGLLDSFFSCGNERLACPTQESFSRLFWTQLPLDTAKIRVTATDFFGRTSFDERLIDLVLPGPDMNLWAESLEITQATQPWLPVNSERRSDLIPTFGYPDTQTTVDAVPLVAGRTTVVRLTAGVENTASDVPVVGARARLRCFTGFEFALPCPGFPFIQPESRPPASLREITVDPADDLDTKRRDATRTWNFVLPRAWVDQDFPVGTDRFNILLEAEVVPPVGIAECDGCDDAANRIRVEAVSFRSVPSFSGSLVHQSRVRRERPSTGTSYTPTNADVAGYVDYLRKTFPVDETTISSFLPVIVSNQEDADGNVFCDNSGGRAVFPPVNLGQCCPDGFRVSAAYLGGNLDGVDGNDCPAGGVASGAGYALVYDPNSIQPRFFFVMAQEVAHANGSQAGPRRGFLEHAGPPPGHGSECAGRCQPNCSTSSFKDCNCNTVEDKVDVMNGATDNNNNNVPDECECRQDSDCTSGDCDTQCDKDWPWEHGIIGEFGFDVFDLTVYPGGRAECETPGVCDNGIDDDGDGDVDEDCVAPGGGQPFDLRNNPHDFMSYGGCPKWISPRTWVRILNGFTGDTLPYPSSDLSPAVSELDPAAKSARSVNGRPVRGAGSASALLIGGRQHDEDWSLFPAYEVDFVSPDTDEGVGEFRIELRDAGGQVLAARNFDTPKTSGSDGHEDSMQFSQTLPLPQGVTSVVLLIDGQVFDQRVRSASAPVVSIVSPDATGFEGQPEAPLARWTATDADGDTLYYLVQYTRGGGTPWRTIATDIRSEAVTVFLDDLGGSSEALVRVLATDGLNTTVAMSAPFVVAGKAPRVEILSPAAGASLLPGQRSVARGLAFDVEDGSIPIDALIWSSDVDGVLGSGGDLDLAILSPGTLHEITLEATDSNAQIGSATVIVEVEESINAQPVADAGPDQFTDSGSAPLDGRGSTDANGDPLDYHWTIVNQPAGGDASLSFPQIATPLFSATVFGIYEIALVVDDGQVESGVDTMTVLVCGDEVNDGIDNECPDDPGFGSVDNISGDAGFLTPSSNTIFSWTGQAGATGYQVARSTAADFSQGCNTFATTAPFIDDPEEPGEGEAPLHYLVRPLTPFAGSWGQTSAGTERTFVCGAEAICDDGIDDDLDGPTDCDDPDCADDPACLAVFSFVDTCGSPKPRHRQKSPSADAG